VFFADVVTASREVAATSRRTAKRDRIARLLRQVPPGEVEAVVAVLSGRIRQGRIGIGWAMLRDVATAAADEPVLSVGDVDRALTALATTAGPGSQAERRAVIERLFARATATEQELLRELLTGNVRQGALDGVMLEAVATAAAVPAEAVRRAHLLSGDLGATALAALVGGRAALDAIGLRVGRALQPMLAATSATPGEALAETGPASVEWKLDGARIQVHRDGDLVRVYTRNLNDVTDRLGPVVEIAASLPVRRCVLDGETLGLDDEGRPRPFQDTMSRFGSDADSARRARDVQLRPWFFDVLHLDGADLVDEPLAVRRDALEGLAAAWCVPSVRTDDPATADAFFREAVAAGHEGVVVKALGAPYEAGRRGASWRKVKPVHTFDLVVLAAEWGHGRRTGWLSNLHLGARDLHGAFGPAGGFVMVGKTFKGLTDELLTWQTAQLRARVVEEDRWVVRVRPELVVEVAVDGVQQSRRYPGGVALRFARVRRYRLDKTAAEADTIDAVRVLGAVARPGDGLPGG
jgi:DNA ligase-1